MDNEDKVNNIATSIYDSFVLLFEKNKIDFFKQIEFVIKDSEDLSTMEKQDLVEQASKEIGDLLQGELMRHFKFNYVDEELY